MPIPDYESLMLPLLRVLATQDTVKLSEAADRLADEFRLTDDERAQLLPSGQSTVLRNRVAWAKTYMKQAGLIAQPKRGEMAITERGQGLLASKPSAINGKVLRQFPEFLEFLARSSAGAATDEASASKVGASQSVGALQDVSPEEQIEAAVQKLDASLRSELLDQIRSASPAFFEQLVVKLLLTMGYGGSRQEAGAAVGRSGDGGIDGVINEDRLGLDAIYIQAKRWADNVGEPQVRDFKGALDARGATKGVLLTTSGFTSAAIEAARNSRAYKIVLIDGSRLTELLIEHGIGVSVAATYQVKRLDLDFFADE